MASVGELAREALRSREPVPGGARLTFHDGPGVHERLRALVEAESRCCPFLALDLCAEDGALVLDVTGPDEAQPTIATLLE